MVRYLFHPYLGLNTFCTGFSDCIIYVKNLPWCRTTSHVVTFFRIFSTFVFCFALNFQKSAKDNKMCQTLSVWRPKTEPLAATRKHEQEPRVGVVRNFCAVQKFACKQCRSFQSIRY